MHGCTACYWPHLPRAITAEVHTCWTRTRTQHVHAHCALLALLTQVRLDLLLSVLRQHANANRARVRPEDAKRLDVMPPHIPISRMPLPTSRSGTGNKFFSYAD